jgi:4-amino-4-deoxy-L-arabinose transferase-like glycosyltransferase
MMRHLLGVVGLYLAIQSCWFIAIPWLEGPDEVQHYDHARYVAVNGHLPDRPPTKINESDFFTGEWTQEVFYYWAAGLVLRQTGFQDMRPGVGLAENPHSVWYGGHSPAVFLHRQLPPPPIRAALLIGRAETVLFGLITLLCVFGAVRACAGGDARVAALAAGCVALVPQFGAQHVLITNDTPAALWGALTSWLVVLFIVRPKPAVWLAAAIGAGTGLAIATKLTAGVILAAMPLALWRLWRRARLGVDPLKPLLTYAIAWGVGLLATAGVAFGRNWIVFGDPLATRMKNAIVTQFGFRAVFKPSELASYGDLTKMLFHGFWASIGWAGWSPESVGLWVLFGVLTAFLFACVIAATRRVLRTWREARVDPADDALIVMLSVFALHTAAFFVSISIWAGFSARYFLPMIVPMIVVTMMGARAMMPGIRQRMGAVAGQWTLIVVVLLLAVGWIATFMSTLLAFHFEGAV